MLDATSQGPTVEVAGSTKRDGVDVIFRSARATPVVHCRHQRDGTLTTWVLHDVNDQWIGRARLRKGTYEVRGQEGKTLGVASVVSPDGGPITFDLPVDHSEVPR